MKILFLLLLIPTQSFAQAKEEDIFDLDAPTTTAPAKPAKPGSSAAPNAKAPQAGAPTAPPKATPTPLNPPTRSKGIRFGVGLNGLLVTTITTAVSNSSGTLCSDCATVYMSSSAALNFDVRMLERESFGFISGLEFINGQTAKSVTISYGGSTTNYTVTSSASTFTRTFIYGGGAYRWNTGYFPLLIHTGQISASNASSSSFKVGFGYATGYGWYALEDHLAFEILYRRTPSTVSDSVSSANYNWTDLAFGMKYFF